MSYHECDPITEPPIPQIGFTNSNREEQNSSGSQVGFEDPHPNPNEAGNPGECGDSVQHKAPRYVSNFKTIYPDSVLRTKRASHREAFNCLLEWAFTQKCSISLSTCRKSSNSCYRPSGADVFVSYVYYFEAICFHCARRHKPARAKDSNCQSGIKSRHPSKRRNTPSMKPDTNGCKFLLKVHQVKGSDGLEWAVDTANPSHNHAPAVNLKNFPKFRRNWLDKNRQKIMELSEQMGPTEVIVVLDNEAAKINLTCPLKPHDISNYLYQNRPSSLLGSCETAKHIQDMREKNEWLFSYSLEENRFSRYFLVHKSSQRLSNYAHQVLFIDGTFSTHLHEMTIVNIVGISPINKSFVVAVCLLRKTTATDYIWLFQQLKQMVYDSPECEADYPATIFTDEDKFLITAIENVFPLTSRLTCVWHMMNDWRKNGKYMEKGFHKFPNCTIKDYEELYTHLQSLISANSAEKFEVIWLGIKTGLGADNSGNVNPLTNYLVSWYNKRETWCFFWTREHVTFGHNCTSPVESIHSALKQTILHNKKHFASLDRLIASLGGYFRTKNDTHLSNIETATYKSFTGSKGTLGDSLMKNVFRNLYMRVDNAVLLKIVQHCDALEKALAAGDVLPACTGTYRRTEGLPCWHTLQKALNDPLRPLVPEDCDKQWRVDLACELIRADAAQYAYPDTILSHEPEKKSARLSTNSSLRQHGTHGRYLPLEEAVGTSQKRGQGVRSREYNDSQIRVPTGVPLSHEVRDFEWPAASDYIPSQPNPVMVAQVQQPSGYSAPLANGIAAQGHAFNSNHINGQYISPLPSQTLQMGSWQPIVLPPPGYMAPPDQFH